jgi:hypothetical protein
VDIAEKGFKSLCFAYLKLPSNFTSLKNFEFPHHGFTFCGFALLQAEKQQDTISTVTELK